MNQGHELRSAFGDDFDGDLPATVDEAAVRRMQAVAYALDESIRVPGTDLRVGLDAVVGLIPGVGDLVTGGLSLYVVVEAARLGVTYTTLLRMLANVAVDVTVGSIPVVGDALDAVWKANKRNLELALADLAATAEAEPEREAVEIEVE